MTSTTVNEQIININRTVKGYYKASVIEPDDFGNLNESFTTGWKSNTILDCGLDKIAYMPWAQTFQFCLVGDYPYTNDMPMTASHSEKMLRRPKKIHAFYVPGENNCGHKVSGSTVRLYRTFDFYKELDNIVYTEIGFKETPAATELFSKIRLDPPVRLHAGQFLRVNYELRVNLNPTSFINGGLTPSPFPVFTGSFSGSVFDKEAIQKVGMCGIDTYSGLAIPIDEAGFCNEPFAPGQVSFGPSYGFTNRYYNGSRVNAYPSASGDTSWQKNPFLAVGPLEEFDLNYKNIYQILDLGVSQSLSLSNGRFSGSFCCPNTSSYLPRNYFTSDFIWGAASSFGIYPQVSWQWSPAIAEGPPPPYGDSGAGGAETISKGTYVINQDEFGSSINNAYTWYYINGVSSTTHAFYWDSVNSKFTYLDNLWTPYSKLATISSKQGVTTLLSNYTNNTNLFNDFFYDPQMQNSGSLSFPKFPSKLLNPGGQGTGSKYEIRPSDPVSSNDQRNTVKGRKIITEYSIIDKKLPRNFPFYDDWNPAHTTASLSNLPKWVKNTGTPGKIGTTAAEVIGTNYYVRGTSCFLSTHTGSALRFTGSLDRSINSTRKVYSVELPTYLLQYTASSSPKFQGFRRDKYVVFNNSVANNEDIPTQYWTGSSAPYWRSLGLGPTSLYIVPNSMNDAAKYNGYVYVFNSGQTKTKDYALKLTFRYSWGRA